MTFSWTTACYLLMLLPSLCYTSCHIQYKKVSTQSFFGLPWLYTLHFNALAHLSKLIVVVSVYHLDLWNGHKPCLLPLQIKTLHCFLHYIFILVCWTLLKTTRVGVAFRYNLGHVLTLKLINHVGVCKLTTAYNNKR